MMDSIKTVNSVVAGLPIQKNLNATAINPRQHKNDFSFGDDVEPISERRIQSEMKSQKPDDHSSFNLASNNKKEPSFEMHLQ